MTSPAPASVASTDGVSVAVHDLSPRSNGRVLLISHANGFCGPAYEPIADALDDAFHSFAVDLRGHGATIAPPGWDEGAGVDWGRFGDDTLAVARAIGQMTGATGQLTGFGHSMGGGSLLMAAHRDPGMFARLVLFEPISAPPPDPPADMYWAPIVTGARRRRRRFDSFEQAFENFRRKPPLSVMTDEALWGYVRHGLRAAPGGGVELCCSPELEAAIYVGGPDNGVWDLLPEIEVPVVVVTGAVAPQHPSFWAQAIAERLPHGELIVLPHQTHLGPFSHPGEVAALVSAPV